MSETAPQMDTPSHGAHAGARDGRPERLRVAIVGASEGPICGVRDHATVLAAALERERVACSMHWLSRTAGSAAGARSEVRAFSRRLRAELERDPPEAVILHYSVFTLSYRGLPLFVRQVLSVLRGLPLLTILHELAYPWRHGGWRGKVWALTQRFALIDVIRASGAVVVTADFRAEWLRSRRWLPQRRLEVAPVFSNLPPPSRGAAAEAEPPLIGLFGYGYQGAAVELILDAQAILRDRGGRARLALLGGPGPDSPAADAWREGAAARGLAAEISFSGTLQAQAMSDALAGCTLLISADTAGPSSRKGSLAASLASGRAVVAVDGRRAWPALLQTGAAEVVQPTPVAVADATAALLADRRRREALGVRGRAFAETEMGVGRTVEAVMVELARLGAGRSLRG